MGYTFEISVWIDDRHRGCYRYLSLWTGESFLKALYHLWKFKKSHGCVKLEWRK